MKFKKESNNVKSVNSKSSAFESESRKVEKDSKPLDDHNRIVKRLMNHSKCVGSSMREENAEVTHSAPTYMSYPGSAQYPPFYHHAPAIYSNGYYSKDFYYQQPQLNHQYSAISPPLSSHSTHNFDQISNDSPHSDYVFNGEFTLNFNTDFDGSFPLIDTAKTPQLFDNQAPLEMKPFDVVSRIGGQLTPVTIESLHDDGEIKNSFVSKNSNVLVNLSYDDVLSNESYLTRSSPDATVDWKFTEHQWKLSVWVLIDGNKKTSERYQKILRHSGISWVGGLKGSYVDDATCLVNIFQHFNEKSIKLNECPPCLSISKNIFF